MDEEAKRLLKQALRLMKRKQRRAH